MTPPNSSTIVNTFELGLVISREYSLMDPKIFGEIEYTCMLYPFWSSPYSHTIQYIYHFLCSFIFLESNTIFQKVFFFNHSISHFSKFSLGLLNITFFLYIFFFWVFKLFLFFFTTLSFEYWSIKGFYFFLSYCFVFFNISKLLKIEYRKHAPKKHKWICKNY